jgi:uncharacterized phage infection (PIP) family protein YhgE
MTNTKKSTQIHFRLSQEDLALFREKAKNYDKKSSMIRDAVRQFDDRGAKMKLQAMTDLSLQIKEFSIKLSKIGGNLNQVVKRANELVYAGELNKEYYEQVILPSIAEVEKIMLDIKEQHSKIIKQLIKA